MVSSASDLGSASKVQKAKSHRHSEDSQAKDVKRRVKTGCLTCRSRRIKCDERRPTCDKCRKSRRNCEYSARLVFLGHPNFLLRPSASQGGAAQTNNAFLHAAPLGHNNPTDVHLANTGAFPNYPRIQPRPQGPDRNLSASSASGRISPKATKYAALYSADAETGLSGTADAPTSGSSHERSLVLPSHVSRAGAAISPTTPGEQSRSDSAADPDAYAVGRVPRVASPSLDGQHHDATAPVSIPTEVQSQIAVDQLQGAHDWPFTCPRYCSAFAEPLVTTGFASFPSLREILENGAVEAEMMDYYDAQSDEDEPWETEATEHAYDSLDVLHKQQQQHLSEMVSHYGLCSQEKKLSSQSELLQSGTLDWYRPDRAANPLQNTWTQLLFQYFVQSTAPGLSVFQSRRTSSINDPIKPSDYGSRAGPWTDMLPKVALQNSGLLHAMLAMSSMELAHKHGEYATASAKHYIWATRRTNRALNNPKDRCSAPILATTLLLAFYEVMTAEHARWSTHVIGAKQLILEVDYRKMARQFWSMVQKDDYLTTRNDSRSAPASSWDISLIQKIMGMTPSYAHLDLHHKQYSPGAEEPMEEDSAKMMQFQDLFFWYLRMDIVRSTVSGEPLLLDYSEWSRCPPRAPLGRVDAVYGSADHLVMLMGRIAAFAAKDRVRKVRDAPSQFPVPFYGMAPPFGAAKMPFSYRNMDLEPEPQEHTADGAPQTKHKIGSLEEWDEIFEICDIFRKRLGPQFEPTATGQETPFGPAHVFATHEIGALWITYYQAMLILLRSHPDLPAAAQVAALVAARDTEFCANEIGRIAAGIDPLSDSAERDDSFTSSFHETTCPLFFAGIQFQDLPRRRWTVLRLLQIAQLHGSRTAAVCASGCESAWEQAAMVGQGPPYQRISRDPRCDSQGQSPRAFNPDYPSG